MVRILALHDRCYVNWIAACSSGAQRHQVIRTLRADVASHLLPRRHLGLLISEADPYRLCVLPAAEEGELLWRLKAEVWLSSCREYARRRERLNRPPICVPRRPFSLPELARLIRAVVYGSSAEFLKVFADGRV